MEREIKRRNTGPRGARQVIPIISGLRKFTIIPIIDPLCYYTVPTIVKLGLIPNMADNTSSKVKMYKLITYRENGLVYPKLETNEFGIMPVDCRPIGAKLPKYKIQGAELIKFLKIHKLLPE